MKSYKQIKNKKRFQIYLDGLILGDGCVSFPKRKGRLPSFKLTIRDKSIAWGHKVKEDIIDFGLNCYIYGPYNRAEINVVSETHPIFWQMKRRWYYKNKKIVPKDLIITPTVLGDWYLGDGKLDKDDIITIFTESFQFKEVRFLSSLLNSAVGIISFVKENEVGNPVIKIRAREVSTFLDYIPKQYRLDCFKYKFDLKGKHRRMKWLFVENELLRKSYKNLPAIDLGKELKRSLSSIYHRVNRLSLNKI